MDNEQAKILVVDDIPQNVKLLVDLLTLKGYAVVTASSGEEALAKVASEKPDLVLLDVMMPGMSGYDVCRRIRADPETALLPVVHCTSLDPQQERINGIAAGADDFLSKPINQPELFARVASLLRIKRLHEQTQRQARQLADWSATLEQRVAEQVAENERLSRLKRFFSPKLAELIVEGSGEDPLKSRRREIVVVYSDLRGFTAFAETSEPEELMRTLGSFHGAMGRLVLAHEATLERFTGDGMMVFLGDPVPVENAAEKGIALALAMRSAALELGGDLAEAGCRPRARHWRGAGVRDRGRHRLRGPDRLWRDRDRHQPRGPPLPAREGRRDHHVATRLCRSERSRRRRRTWASCSCTASRVRRTRFVAWARSVAARNKASDERATGRAASPHSPALLPGRDRRAVDARVAQGRAATDRRRIGGVLLGECARRHDGALCGTPIAAAGHETLFRTLLRVRRVVVPASVHVALAAGRTGDRGDRFRRRRNAPRTTTK